MFGDRKFVLDIIFEGAQKSDSAGEDEEDYGLISLDHRKEEKYIVVQLQLSSKVSLMAAEI